MLVGIDLGTTNSAVAIWRDGAARLVPNPLGDLLTPSAVSLDKSGESYVGAAALDRLATHPADTATSFKRLMGTDKKSRLGGREYRAEELSALVLMALCRDVEADTGTAPGEAVITVPAYFNDRQRKATRRAGELAGLSVRRLINEPTASRSSCSTWEVGLSTSRSWKSSRGSSRCALRRATTGWAATISTTRWPR